MLLKLRHKIRTIVSRSRERRKEKLRSPEWKKVRDDFLEKNPKCAACGGDKKLQVHHKIPFHINPTLELVDENLMTLCMDTNECHLEIGHGDSWKCYNPKVEEDAGRFLSSDTHHRKFLLEQIKTKRIYMSKNG